MSGTPPAALLVLSGPTACGKSALALELAERIGAEIISADSCSVYRGMDIGAAKPSAAERARVPHHLVDIRDPDAPYSAGAFCADAARAARDIAARGRIPLVVGGAMMWLRRLRDGMDDRPRCEVLREELKREMNARGARAMHRELTEQNPAAARRIHPRDRARIVRALEVERLTRRGGGAKQADAKAEEGEGWEGRMGAPMRALLLMPKDRALLRARIRTRLDAMFAAGFVEETRRLMRDWHLDGDSIPLRAVGYRQVYDYLRGRTASEEECRRLAWHATCQLAKRQMTWLRSWPDAETADPFAPGTRETALRLAEEFAAARRGG